MNRPSSRISLERDATSFAIRLSLFYAAIFLLIGFHLPFFPVWLAWRGLSAQEIGVVLAAPLAIRIFFAPGISFVADRISNRRLVLILLAWASILSLLLFAATTGFWTVLAVAMLAAIFWTSIMPLTEAVAMEGVRSAGLSYGRIRLWGSLSFIAASFSGGVILQQWGPPAALWMMILAAVFIAFSAHFLPRPAGRGRLKKATELPHIRLRDAFALVRSPLFLLFLLTTGGVQGAHAVYYAFGTLHWQAQGIPTATIGLLWAVGVVAEILLFWFARGTLLQTGTTALIWFAALASVVRWAATAFSPPLWLLLPLQALHGLTFGAAHLGAIHFISEAVEEKMAGTAQGLYAAFTAGIAMGIGIAAAGPLYAALGGQAYLVMAGVGLAATAGAGLLKRAWKGGRLLTPDDS